MIKLVNTINNIHVGCIWTTTTSSSSWTATELFFYPNLLQHIFMRRVTHKRINQMRLLLLQSLHSFVRDHAISCFFCWTDSLNPNLGPNLGARHICDARQHLTCAAAGDLLTRTAIECKSLFCSPTHPLHWRTGMHDATLLKPAAVRCRASGEFAHLIWICRTASNICVLSRWWMMKNHSARIWEGYSAEVAWKV